MRIFFIAMLILLLQIGQFGSLEETNSGLDQQLHEDEVHCHTDVSAYTCSLTGFLLLLYAIGTPSSAKIRNKSRFNRRTNFRIGGHSDKPYRKARKAAFSRLSR
jgi:hypothetical protein